MSAEYLYGRDEQSRTKDARVMEGACSVFVRHEDVSCFMSRWLRAREKNRSTMIDDHESS